MKPNFIIIKVELGVHQEYEYYEAYADKPSIGVEDELFLEGKVRQELLATEEVDNEENCVRLVEQMVREAFKRAREKNVPSSGKESN